MIEFQVNDMSCGHCVAAITRAVQALDPGAEVEIDLAAQRVRVRGGQPAEVYARAIRDEGYTPDPVAG